MTTEMAFAIPYLGECKKAVSYIYSARTEVRLAGFPPVRANNKPKLRKEPEIAKIDEVTITPESAAELF